MTGTAEKPTVLVVDDDPNLRKLCSAALEGEYKVLLAENGQQALKQVYQHRPDVVLLDVTMPVMDGWETTRTLKADPDTAAIPVIAVTAHAMESDRARAAEIGFSLFLTKPVEPRRVVSEVRRLLGVED